MFDTLIAFPKEFFEKVKKSADDKRCANLPSMQRV